MFFKYFIFIVLVSAFLISCSRNKFDGQNGLKIVMFPDSDDTCQVIEYKNGKRNGYLKEYYQNGKIKTIQHFIDDKNVDTAKFYHPNGNPEAIQIYKNGFKSGCWLKYNPNGKVYSKIPFVDGMFDGEALTYSYKSLNLIERFNFKKGFKDGKQELFYNSGKPKSVCYFHNGQACLGLKEWYESGKEINNDFKINYTEVNKVNLENKLYYYITLENPKESDEVYTVMNNDTGRVLTRIQRLEKIGDKFVLQFNIYNGGFIMEKIKLAAHRKTDFGNIYIKTLKLTVSVNNY